MRRVLKHNPIFMFLLSIIFAFVFSFGYSSWSTELPEGFTSGTLSPTKSTPVAFYKDGDNTHYFASIESAVEHANEVASSTNKIEVRAIVSVKKITIKRSFTIDSDVSLILPYSDDSDSNCLYYFIDTAHVDNSGTYAGWDTTAYDSNTVNTRKINADNHNATNSTYSPTPTNILSICTKEALYGAKAASHCQLEVTVQNGVTITNNGTIRIGGIQSGAGGGYMAGFISTKFAAIKMVGSANIVSNGKMVNFGFIYRDIPVNNISITFSNTSITYIPFVLIEHRGGTHFSNLYFAGLLGSAFNRFYFISFPELKCSFSSQSVLISVPDLYASSRHNRCIVNLLGESALLDMTSYPDAKMVVNFTFDQGAKYYKCKEGLKNAGAWTGETNWTELTPSFFLTTTSYSLGDIVIKDGLYYECISETGSLGQWVSSKWKMVTFFEFNYYKKYVAGDYAKKDGIPKHTIDIYGNAKLNSLTLVAAGQDLDTKTVYFPLSCYYDINLHKYENGNSATFSSSLQKIKVLPGSTLTIDSGVTLSIPGLAVYNANTANLTGPSAQAYERKTSYGYCYFGGSIVTDYLNGTFYPTSDSSALTVRQSVNSSMYEVSDGGASYVSFTLATKSVLYEAGTTPTQLFVDDYQPYYNGDYYAIDGLGGRYSVEYTHLVDGDVDPGFVASNIVKNNALPSHITSTLTYSTPTYNSGYSFEGLYLDSDLTHPLYNYESYSVPEISSVVDKANHKYSLVANWVNNANPFAKYFINKYNGTTALIEQDDPTKIDIGPDSTVYIDGPDSRKSIITSSQISTYDFKKWVAKVYLNGDASTLSNDPYNTIDLDYDSETNKYSFTFSSTNVSMGNYVKITPVYEETTYSLPTATITFENSNVLAKGGYKKATLTISNLLKDENNIGYYGANIASYPSSARNRIRLSTGGSNITIKDNNASSATTLSEIDYTSRGSWSGNTWTLDFYLYNGNSKDSKEETSKVDLNIYIVGDVGQDTASSPYQYSYSSPSYTYKTSCFDGEMFVETEDKKKKRLKDLKRGDKVLCWNFEKGMFEYMPVIIIERITVSNSKKLYITFDNGTTLEIISHHDLFFMDTRRFENINLYNFEQFVGREAFINNNGYYESHRIVSVRSSEYSGEAYSAVTLGNLNVVVQGVLTTMPFEMYQLFFELDNELKYNKESFDKDIERFGTYSYDELHSLLQPYIDKFGICEELLHLTYEGFKAKYFKVALGKGLVTFEDVVHLLNGCIDDKYSMDYKD